MKNNKMYVPAMFCQQGINYWFNNVDPYDIASNIKQGGVFVFNTFYKEPPKFPAARQYDWGDRTYTEVSYLVGNKVMHVQACEGYEPHVTSFDWIPENIFVKKLGQFFDVKVIKENNSAIFVCR